MKKDKQIKYFETGLYTTLFTIALLVPFLTSTRFEERDWNFVFRGWLHLVPFVVVFIINNYFLAPKLLLKGKYWQYILSCIAIVATIIFIDYSLLSKERNELKFDKEKNGIQMEGPPRHENFREFREQDRMNPERRMPPRGIQDHQMGPHHGPFRPPFFNFGAIVIYFLLIGFNSGVKIFVRWNEEQNRLAEKDKQHLSTELAFLKHQISPHFFMNTLNNIHALVDIDSEGAKEAIIKLSRLMRYLLYESEEKTSLKKEIEFLESYIELMRLRYNEQSLEIHLDYPDNLAEITVPSFLFLSFVENAFKHGVDPNNKSQIEISFKIQDKELLMNVRNHKCTRAIISEIKEGSGIGLENVKKRLQLIYKDNYTLSIKDLDNLYEVSLRLPVL